MFNMASDIFSINNHCEVVCLFVVFVVVVLVCVFDGGWLYVPWQTDSIFYVFIIT